MGSKLEAQLIEAGLQKRPEPDLDNHIKESVEEVILLRFAGYRRHEIKNYLFLSEEQLEKLWKMCTTVNTERRPIRKVRKSQ